MGNSSLTLIFHLYFEGLLEPKFVHVDFLCFSEVGLIFQGKRDKDRERCANRVLGNVKYNNF